MTATFQIKFTWFLFLVSLLYTAVIEQYCTQSNLKHTKISCKNTSTVYKTDKRGMATASLFKYTYC